MYVEIELVGGPCDGHTILELCESWDCGRINIPISTRMEPALYVRRDFGFGAEHKMYFLDGEDDQVGLGQ